MGGVVLSGAATTAQLASNLHAAAVDLTDDQVSRLAGLVEEPEPIGSGADSCLALSDRLSSHGNHETPYASLVDIHVSCGVLSSHGCRSDHVLTQRRRPC
ncbi:hypothetical protein GCM10023238_33580 [Streptomyces heliomycini]